MSVLGERVRLARSLRVGFVLAVNLLAGCEGDRADFPDSSGDPAGSGTLDVSDPMGSVSSEGSAPEASQTAPEDSATVPDESTTGGPGDGSSTETEDPEDVTDPDDETTAGETELPIETDSSTDETEPEENDETTAPSPTDEETPAPTNSEEPEEPDPTSEPDETDETGTDATETDATETDSEPPIDETDEETDTPEECTGTETQCAGQDFQVCSGGEWMGTETCEFGCDDDDGCASECQANEKQCVGSNQIKSCAANGTWGATTSCTDDGIACTDDVCEANACVSKLKSDACYIGSTCYTHNQDNPSNSCQYCDSASDSDQWTSRSSNTTCDDNVWCNGTDTCNGGACTTHQFPTGTRCTGGDACNNTCNESAKNCFSPATTECDSDVELECQAGCGSDVRSRTVKRFCTGSAATCTGQIQNGDWEVEESCGSGEVCTGNACGTDFQCSCTASGNFYDSSTDLCWQSTPSTNLMSKAQAIAYCQDGTWGEFNDWELPNIDELLTLVRGCQDGDEGDANDLTECNMSPNNCSTSCSEATSCLSCTEGAGPSNGCYWLSGLSGFCFHYWSSTLSASSSLYSWRVSYNWGDTSTGSHQDSSYYARCVRR